MLEVGGHHVGRQPVAQVRAQHVVGGPGGAGAQRVVADELRGAGHRLVGVDHGLGDAGHLQEHRLDLGQLDAVAADLDLQVDPAEVLDLAVRGDPAQVAGAVDAARGVAGNGEEIGDERPGGEVVAVDVALRQPDPGDADLADLAGRQRTVRVVGVEDHRCVGRQRDADRHRPVRFGDGPGRADRRLGRAVDVEEPPAGPVPAHDQVVRAGLARHQQEAQPGEIVFEGSQQRRHAAHRGDPALGEERVQVGAEQAAAGRLRHEGRADRPRNPDLLEGEVEGDRQTLVDAVVRPDAVHLRGHPDEVHDARVLDRHALGPARGAGGVDDVGQLVDRRPALCTGDPGPALPADAPRHVVDGDDQLPHLLQVREPQVRERQHGRRRGVRRRCRRYGRPGSRGRAAPRRPRP